MKKSKLFGYGMVFLGATFLTVHILNENVTGAISAGVALGSGIYLALAK